MSELPPDDAPTVPAGFELDGLPKVPGVSKFTEENRSYIYYCLSRGGSYEEAAGIAGITVACLREWRKRGEVNLKDHLECEVPLNTYGEFTKRLKQIRAQATMKAVECFYDAATREWQASAEFLGRRNQKEWGRRQVTSVEQNTTMTIVVKRTDDWGQVQGGQIAGAIPAEFTPDDDDE